MRSLNGAAAAVLLLIGSTAAKADVIYNLVDTNVGFQAIFSAPSFLLIEPNYQPTISCTGCSEYDYSSSTPQFIFANPVPGGLNAVVASYWIDGRQPITSIGTYSVTSGTATPTQGIVTVSLSGLPVNFGDVIKGAVTLAPSGHDMIAHFIPNGSLSLSAAAALGGFDHFDRVYFFISLSRRAVPKNKSPERALALFK